MGVWFANSHALPYLLSSLSPNAAVVLATVGLLLIFVELNRPGRIVPGATGLVLFLFALASLSHHAVMPAAVAAICAAFTVFLLNVWRPLPLWSALAPTSALAVGLICLLPHDPRIHPAVGLTCGVVVGLLNTALSRIAFRARRLKAVH